jgi:hypothetical protein
VVLCSVSLHSYDCIACTTLLTLDYIVSNVCSCSNRPVSTTVQYDGPAAVDWQHTARMANGPQLTSHAMYSNIHTSTAARRPPPRMDSPGLAHGGGGGGTGRGPGISVQDLKNMTAMRMAQQQQAAAATLAPPRQQQQPPPPMPQHRPGLGRAHTTHGGGSTAPLSVPPNPSSAALLAYSLSRARSAAALLPPPNGYMSPPLEAMSAAGGSMYAPPAEGFDSRDRFELQQQQQQQHASVGGLGSPLHPMSGGPPPGGLGRLQQGVTVEELKELTKLRLAQQGAAAAVVQAQHQQAQQQHASLRRANSMPMNNGSSSSASIHHLQQQQQQHYAAQRRPQPPLLRGVSGIGANSSSSNNSSAAAAAASAAAALSLEDRMRLIHPGDSASPRALSQPASPCSSPPEEGSVRSASSSPCDSVYSQPVSPGDLLKQQQQQHQQLHLQLPAGHPVLGGAQQQQQASSSLSATLSHTSGSGSAGGGREEAFGLDSLPAAGGGEPSRAASGGNSSGNMYQQYSSNSSSGSLSMQQQAQQQQQYSQQQQQQQQQSFRQQLPDSSSHADEQSSAVAAAVAAWEQESSSKQQQHANNTNTSCSNSSSSSRPSLRKPAVTTGPGRRPMHLRISSTDAFHLRSGGAGAERASSSSGGEPAGAVSDHAPRSTKAAIPTQVRGAYMLLLYILGCFAQQCNALCMCL